MSETKKIGPSLTVYHKSSTKLVLQLRQRADKGSNMYFELSDGTDEWVVDNDQVTPLVEMFKAIQDSQR